MVGIEDGVRTGVVALGEIRLDPFCVYCAVDDDVRHMDILRPELARHRLRQCPHSMLAAGEG